MILLRKFALLASLATSCFAYDKTLLQKADSLYTLRHTNASGAVADTTPIKAALYQYALATQPSDAPASAWANRLRSYSFLGTYTSLGPKGKQAVFAKAVLAADSAQARYPKDADVLFWTTVLWARYAEEHGKVKVARQGVAEKLRIFTQNLVNMAPNYYRGSAWMIYALVQAGTPHIPFFLEWPSTEKAEAGFRQALALDPKRSLNLFLLGDFLVSQGRNEEAKPYLLEALRIPPDPKDKVEEAHYRAKVRELLKKIH